MSYSYDYENAPVPGYRPPRAEHPPRAERPPRRECVSFQVDVPERLALAYADGKLVDSPGGARVMYSLTDGRVMFLDPDVAQKIARAQIQPRQEFWLCKRKGAGRGAATQWDFYLEDPTPRPQESPLERDLRLSISQAERRKEKEITAAAPPRPSAQPTQENVAPPPPTQSIAARAHAEWVNSLVANTNTLTDAFAATLQHAAQYGQSFKSEDVRTLLVTSFINASQRRAS